MSEDSLTPKLAKTFPVGTVLFTEGESGSEMFIILSGEVRVTKQVGPLERTLALLGPGEFIGEMAILTGEVRSATATVSEEARLVPIDGEMLEQLVKRSPEVAVRLLKRLAFRLKAANDLAAILLSRDARVRVVSGLALLVETRGVERAEDEVFVEVEAKELAAQLGLETPEVVEVLQRLERGGMVQPLPEEHGYLVRDLGRLSEFVEFLAARETEGEIGG